MELKLSRELADKRLFPAIDVNSSRHPAARSSSPRPTSCRSSTVCAACWAVWNRSRPYQTLVPRLKKTPTNRDFLAAIVQQSNSSAVNGN